MSLLMKALEKAAKDRNDARVEPVQQQVPAAVSSAAPAPNTAPRTELTLEPIAPITADSPAPSRQDAIAARPPSLARPPAAPAAAAPAREPAQAQAATLMQAGGAGSAASEGGVMEYVRTHPLPVLGVLAALLALGFGIYVYLQIARHGSLTGQPPLGPKGPPPSSPLTEAP